MECADYYFNEVKWCGSVILFCGMAKCSVEKYAQASVGQQTS